MRVSVLNYVLHISLNIGSYERTPLYEVAALNDQSIICAHNLIVISWHSIRGSKSIFAAGTSFTQTGNEGKEFQNRQLSLVRGYARQIME